MIGLFVLSRYFIVFLVIIIATIIGYKLGKKISFPKTIALIVFLVGIVLTYLIFPSWFAPQKKIIQYQEEVKLSDGSFIWVDIKRHYSWSGWAPGGGSGAYMPGIVEISWDTGFEGMGRQSVFFDNHIYLIDKYQDEWYVIGYRYPYEGSRDGIDAVNCRDVGVMLNSYDCLTVIDKKDQFVKKSSYKLNVISAKFRENLIWTTGDNDWQENISPFLVNNRLSWQTKLSLKNRQSVEKPYQITY